VSDGPILLCFDGSDGAGSAIETAAALFAGREAVSATFWQPFAKDGGRFGINILELVQNAGDMNGREAALAQKTAEEGAAIATRAGLSCTASAVEVERPIDEAIIAHADEVDASVIVLGARGRSGVSSMLLGDVSHDVVQRSTRTVLVVPSAGLSGRRREELDSGAHTA
jgi:nucleotide-binding universal stress UspA family protein